MIIVKTPMRVSLFGGGTDYPSHFKEHGGAVLGMAVDKYCWITLRKLPPFFEHRHRIVYSKVETVYAVGEIHHPAVRAILEEHNPADGLEIHHDADLPSRSGMGSSSSFTVGLLHALAALDGRMASKRELAEEAIRMEQSVIKENVGSQDQIWAAYGGLNRIDFYDGGFTVHPLLMSRARRDELVSLMALYFTGFSRNSSEVAQTQMNRVRVNTGVLNYMKQLVDDATEFLLSDRPLGELLGSMLHTTWEHKKFLSPDVSTPEIDALYAAGLTAGAWGGKLLGAGSGGFLLFIVPPEKREQLRAAMGGRIEIKVAVDYDGSKVVMYQPNGF